MSGSLPSRLSRAARAAVDALRGDRLVERALAGRRGQPLLAGAGKAVGEMARGAQRAIRGARCGVLIGKHAVEGLPVRVAGHPLPDERGVAATEEMIGWLGGLGDDDEVIFLLSGGASALLAAPLPGLGLDDLRRATDALLRGGATISEINLVRRRLGAALGGRLALGTRARLEVLALSDVIGDDPTTIGSGPTVGDGACFADALTVALRCGVDGGALAFLRRGAAGLEPETPRPDDPRLGRASFRLLATPLDLRGAAAASLRAEGLLPIEDEGLVAGDVEEVARGYGARLSGLDEGEVLVAVGEPTVRVSGDGRGGRSQQLALLMARLLDGTDGVFLTLGSDGSDGPTDAAGALVDGGTWARAQAGGLDPETALRRCDSHPLLDALGALVRTGPTGTNLLDLHLLARPARS